MIEASTDSEWVARCLEAFGHEVIVADPNFAPMYATRTRKVKTDRRDARALAEAACSAPTAPPIASPIPSATCGAASWSGRPVHTRTVHLVIRALLRQHGYRVPSGQCRELHPARSGPAPAGPLALGGRPAACAHAPLNQQLAYSER